MQRGLVQCLAWVLATGAAVTLSWYGVRTVLTGTAYDPPRALPITDGSGSANGAWSSSTHRPKPPSSSATSPSPPPSPSSPSPPGADAGSGGGKDKGSDAAGRTRKPTQPPSRRDSPRPEESGEVRSYPAKGGRAVFDIRAASADLVSATPDGGWQMQVWKQSEWIRVDFVSGADTTTIFCTWHDGPPQVRIDEH
ncbi:hypothetical protein VT50_0220950 [Streptomyces antioxidans]|uniref:Secreted protein n=1 Tax=Streptomyces antioxidans TaxID=1507734 RepID=A0A1V4D2X4_9ACTN|nr:hypothetical protein [Streptomyces antioxidans]OPF77752.1 hypothetical protein VT50_0220950 [Streptomyces antioxidans]